jgi:Ca2+/H+ antiporter
MQFNGIAGTAVDLTARDWVLIGLSAGGLVLFGKKNPGPVSYCDTSPVPLDRMRVNAGLIVVWLLAVQALLTDGRSTWLQTPVWICIFAVLILFVIRLAKGQSRSMHVD